MLDIQGVAYSTCRPNPEDAQKDKIDAAAVKLEPWIVRGLLESGAKFLPFERLERSATVAERQCALTGYPDGSVEWNSDFELSKAEAIEIHVELLSNNESKKRLLKPNIHVIAKYGNVLADGTRQPFPKPDGMSGGVVWVLGQDGPPKAAGIITTLISRNSYKRALLCTRMGGIAKIIENPSQGRIIKLRDSEEALKLG
jgi:hypothetical protein